MKTQRWINFGEKGFYALLILALLPVFATDPIQASPVSCEINAITGDPRDQTCESQGFNTCDCTAFLGQGATGTAGCAVYGSGPCPGATTGNCDYTNCAACVPNNCQANTCQGSTCVDNCGVTRQGTSTDPTLCGCPSGQELCGSSCVPIIPHDGNGCSLSCDNCVTGDRCFQNPNNPSQTRCCTSAGSCFADDAPVITSALSKTTAQNSPFTYQILATNNPTSYDATPLPPGLTRNTTTGLINGTPTTAGNFSITISASNSNGTGSAQLSLTVSSNLFADAQFISQNVPLTMTAGQRYPVQISMKNTGTVTWNNDNSNPFCLGAQNPRDNNNWGNSRDCLTPGESVAPGATRVFAFDVVAPSTPNTYHFQWMMVHENGQYRWFGQLSDNIDIPVSGSGGTPPTITTPPNNQSVVAGQTATFSIVANGGTLTYRWQKNGADVPNGCNQSYTTPPTTLNDNGATYRCIVSNAVGPTTSPNATLTVTAAPVPPGIIIGPRDQSVTVGQPATFSVAPSGTTPFTYVWRKNGGDIPNSNTAVYTTPPTTLNDNGSTYTVFITNAAGSTTSNPPAILTVTQTSSNPVLPTIIQQPPNRSVMTGQTATFNVIINGGTAPFTYLWRKNGQNLSNSNSNSYTTLPTVIGDNGAIFSCVITNAAGPVTSNNGVLTVTNATPAAAAVLLDNAIAFPVPYQPAKGHTLITFNNLGSDTSVTIKIYTIMGELVKELRNSAGLASITWNVKNEDDEPVASGVYIYQIKNSVSEKRGKLVIIR